MKSKDPGPAKPCRAGSGPNKPDPASSSSSSANQQTDIPSCADWPVLQMLRRNLKVMGKPLPGFITQLLGTEGRFPDLDAKPRAISVQWLDESDTLRESVVDFPLGEEGLLGDVTSRTRLQGAAPEIASRVDGGDRSGLDAANPDAAVGKAGNQGSVAPRSPLAAHTSASGHRSPDVFETYSKQMKEAASENPVEDGVLTPDFMRLWIDEILSTDRPDARNASATGTKQPARGPGNVSIEPRRVTREVLSEPRVASRTAQPVSAVVSVPVRNKNGDQAAAAKRSTSGRSQAGTEMPATGRSGTVLKQPSPGVSAEASIHTPGTVLPGVALLRQLVQLEHPEAASDPVRPDTPRFNATQNPIRADQHRLVNITAGREAETSLHRGGIAENPVVPGPGSRVADSHGFVCQDESDRIATLVNDALVEQAIRHGVDLS